MKHLFLRCPSTISSLYELLMLIFMERYELLLFCCFWHKPSLLRIWLLTVHLEHKGLKVHHVQFMCNCRNLKKKHWWYVCLLNGNYDANSNVTHANTPVPFTATTSALQVFDPIDAFVSDWHTMELDSVVFNENHQDSSLLILVNKFVDNRYYTNV